MPAQAFRRGRWTTPLSSSKKVHALADLEDLLADDGVLVSWRCSVAGATTGSNGVRLTVNGLAEIVGPAPNPLREKRVDAGDDDCDEHDDLVCLAGSDVEDGDVRVVDTDAETDDASTKSDDFDNDAATAAANPFLRPMLAPASISTLEVARHNASHKRPHQPVWKDEYFWVYLEKPDNSKPNGNRFLKCSCAANSLRPTRRAWATWQQ